MTGMKPWERSIIEYRPDIGLNSDILSIVNKRSAEDNSEESWTLFNPTPVVSTAASMLGVDMLESVMATLSRANQLLLELEAKLAHDNTAVAYKQALQAGEVIDAERIYLKHLTDINGNKAFDTYPMLANLVDEMEVYLDQLNKELFDGSADYSDMSIIRVAEEQQVSALIDIESEDLRVTLTSDLTEEQIALINRYIEDETYPVSSVEEYLQSMADKTREDGSPRINYDDISARVQVIATALDKSNMFRDTVGMIDGYVNSKLTDLLLDDLEGSLEYLVDVEDSLPDMKEAFVLTFDHHANQAKQTYLNQGRVANREVREFLDKKLSEVRQQKAKIVGQLKKFHDTDKFQSNGGNAIMSALRDGVDAANATWKYILVEHMGTSEMNMSQNQLFIDNLSEKNKSQSFYHYADLVDREFDTSNKDKELKSFITTHGLSKR